MFLCYCVAWPCDLDLWPFDLESCSCSCTTHIPIFIILRLSVTELRVLNIWSHFRYLKQSLRMRTWPVHSRSPETTRNKFLTPNFDPELPNHYTTFIGLRWRLRVVYIGASPRKATVGRRSQKNCTVIIGPIMAVFRKFKCLNIKYSYRDPQKAHPWPKQRLLTYFFVEIRSGVARTQKSVKN